MPDGGRLTVQPARQAGARLVADPTVERLAVRDREIGQVIGAELQAQIATPRQFDRVGQRFGQISEQGGHVLAGLEVLLGAVVARPARVIEHPAAGDADARFVGVEIVATQEADIVAGQQGQVVTIGEGDGGGVEGVLAVAPGTGDFQVQAIGKLAAPVIEQGFGAIAAAGSEQAAKRARVPCDQEQAVAIVAQPIRPDPDMIALMTFQVGAREQARQCQIAIAIPTQHGDPAALLTGVGQVQIGADDRLDAGGFGGLVELDQGEQVALIGDRHRRLPQFDAAFHQRLDAQGRIDQRVFAVQVQVDEGGGHAGRAWIRASG